MISFVAGFALGTLRVSRHANAKARREPSARDRVPYVDATITRALSSPDFSRIALLLWDGNDPSLALFDPSAERIIWRESPGDSYDQFCWSPDGRWLAAVIDKGLAIVDRDGHARLVDKEGSYPVWRGPNSQRLAYAVSPYEGPGEARDYEPATGRHRSIRRLPARDGFMGIFGTRGRFCAAYLYERADYSWERIEVVDLDSGRQVLNVPGYQTNIEDAGFEMSPDGKVFTIRGHVSGSIYFIMGRVSEAATTLKRPNRAVLYQVDTGGVESVTWALDGSSDRAPYRTSSDPKYALVNSAQLRPMVIDLETGSMWGSLRPDQAYSWIDWWKPNPGVGPDEQFLVVRPDGLWTVVGDAGAGLYLGSEGSHLLLRHKRPY